MAKLARVVPNERWQLVVEFVAEGFRIFDSAVARDELGWAELAFPDKFKNLTFTEDQVSWPGARTLGADYLLSKSRPIDAAALANQHLRLSYKNQAPTATHRSHHVFEVCLYPFGARRFELGESIGGGHAEMGGSNSYSLAELVNLGDWRRHFELAGCGWAVELVETTADERGLLDALIKEVCRRSG